MKSRTCPECGESLLGRIDKKFCSDLCRNAHNNKLNSFNNNFVRNINNCLRKNRRILAESLVGETTKVSRQKLNDKGYNFSYFTNLSTTKNNHTYYFCYEYGYLFLENDMVLIVKKRAE